MLQSNYKDIEELIMNKVIPINTDNFLYYIEQSNAPVELLHDKIPAIDSIISGDKSPTYNQLE